MIRLEERDCHYNQSENSRGPEREAHAEAKERTDQTEATIKG